MVKKTVSRRTSQAGAAAPRPGRTHTGEARSERWICAVSDADGLLAVVRGGSSVRVVDVHTGAVRGEHAFAGTVTALAWGGAAAVAAVHGGAVSVYSPARNAVVATAAEGCVDVACAGGSVFTLDGSGAVRQWDAAGGRCVRRVATGVAGAQRLLVSRDASRVVVASHRAEVWDVARGARVAALGAHAAPVHGLCWAAGDESAVATAAPGDRAVLVWGAGADAGPEPRAVLAADADIECIDAGADGSVAAVAGGSVCAWFAGGRGGPGAGGSAARAPDTVLAVAGAAGALPVRGVRLSRVPGDEARALLIRGSPAAPLCEAVALAGRDGRFDARVELLRRDPGCAPAAKQAGDVCAHAYSEAGASVGSAAPPAPPAPAPAPAATPSLADRMGQLSVGATAAAAAAAADAKQQQGAMRLPAATLVRVLVQSLHTDDQKLLDTVLDNSSRALVVRDTVLQLPPAYVLPLLQQLMARLHSAPARAARLLPWIRNTLAMHSAYLVSIPSLAPQLAGFCHAIDGRLESHAKLLRLGGRLELAAANFKAADARRQDAAGDVRADMLPINVYNEEDEDEEEGGTEPPTPAWQAEESTDDDDDSSDDGIMGSDAADEEEEDDDDDQWSDNESEPEDTKGGGLGSAGGAGGAGGDDDDDDDDDDDSEMESNDSDNDL
ncbi:Small subunit (SSU) processome component [Coemansia sp. BCRC 34962]|nr:Small subunit (SSU) processome component [Coemansia sp. BCRC 34962]